MLAVMAMMVAMAQLTRNGWCRVRARTIDVTRLRARALEDNTTSHQAPLTSHRAPLTSHHAPLTSHRAPLTSHRAPLTSHPLTSHYCVGLGTEQAVPHKPSIFQPFKRPPGAGSLERGGWCTVLSPRITCGRTCRMYSRRAPVVETRAQAPLFKYPILQVRGTLSCMHGVRGEGVF
jgi:hypothetical protein